MKILTSINKPQYLFRPRQVLRRLWKECIRSPGETEMVMLPWGWPIRVNPREMIGRAIWTQGIFDMVLTELVWRLVCPGDTAVDVGANIGYITSILAKRSGPEGKVFSFEPHPEIHGELEANMRAWRARPDAAALTSFPFAISDRDGEGVLEMDAYFDINRGTAKLAAISAGPGKSFTRQQKVPLRRLDSVLPPGGEIGFVKIDVELHELPVLRGLGAWLEQRRVRDLVFEEYEAYPARTHQLLEAAGYTFFCAEEHLTGLRLKPVTDPCRRRPYESPSCLATADPQRARRLCLPRGWLSLSATPPACSS